MEMKNPYQPIAGEIVDIVPESPTIKTFVLKLNEPFRFLAGQFIELTLPGIGEAPFTPSSSPHQIETVEVTIMKTGFVTNALHESKPGTVIGVRGPYGNWYPLDKLYGKEVLIVGGGVGMAPLRSLLLALLHEKEKFKKIILCCGARTPADFIYKQLFSEWRKIIPTFMSVDKTDGQLWDYDIGVVTVLLPKAKQEIEDISTASAAVCGPPLMLKFTTLKLLELGFKEENIYLSLERMMYCGIGQCRHCMIDKYFVCKDGPVFTYDQIKHITNVWI